MFLFDRFVALLTLVLAAAAAWAAWLPYRWQCEERRKRAETERRLGALLARLENKRLEEWEPIDPSDEDAVSLGMERQVLARQINSGGRWLVRRRLMPSG